MQPKYPFPECFVSTNIEERGQEGVEWLKRLPSILAGCEQRWSIKLGRLFRRFRTTMPRLPCALTAQVWWSRCACLIRDFVSEVEALRLYDGVGAAQLYEYDIDLGVMLLEHLTPGAMLSSVESDEEAITIAASVMRKIWHPPPAGHHFLHVSDWARGMEKCERSSRRSGAIP